MFAHDVCKMCKNIGLLPDKIALHIKELIDPTEKVPLDQLSDHIQRNKIMPENTSTSTTMVALNQAKTALEQFQEQV
jgi:hypothetical protein